MNEPSAVQSLARSWSWKRFFVRSSLICLALCVGAVAIGVWKIRSTLPRLDGTLRVVGIQHKVQIQRDNLGVPSILAQSRDDAAYGLGFAHAQDRFFQMDLLRRIPSGRMGELFGLMGLRLDRSFRKHRFEATSQLVIDARQTIRELETGLSLYAGAMNDFLNNATRGSFWVTTLR